MACLADAGPLLDLQSVRALSGVLVARRQCVGVFGGKSSGVSGACRRFCGWARLEASLRFYFGDCRHKRHHEHPDELRTLKDSLADADPLLLDFSPCELAADGPRGDYYGGSARGWMDKGCKNGKV